MRHDGRAPDELRPLDLLPGFVETADGSVLFSIGRTRVICTASVDEDAPRWLRGTRPRLGHAPSTGCCRRPRASGSSATASRGRPDGRSIEIQRLIGRSLRAVVDLEALGERTVWVDCDVLQADGGTRCAVDLRRLRRAAPRARAARRRGKLRGAAADRRRGRGLVRDRRRARPCSTSTTREDSSAEVDINVVMTSGGRLVEVQGTAEGQPFDRAPLDRLLELGAGGMERIEAAQLRAVAAPPMSRLRAVLATGNAGKAAELSRLLGRDVEAARDRASRRTRRHVRRQRAAQGARRARGAPDGRIGLGDDSGLEVAALGGEPGLRSARWAGPTDADRNAALLERLGGAADRSRRVRVRARRGPARRPRDRRRGTRRGRDRRRAARRRGVRLRPALRADGDSRTVAQLAPDEKDASRIAGAPRARSRPRSGRPGVS